MRKPIFWSLGAVVGSIAIVACVGDAATPPATGSRGELNGPCFANGTCNTGLACNVVDGAAKCVAADGGAPADAGVDASDAGLPVCSLGTTQFPCTGQMMGAGCYGATQTCAITGCNDPTNQRWECFSPNQCSTLPCCVPADSATLHTGKNCTQGALEMMPAITTGSSCGTGLACKINETQLCQFNAQCPPGQICSAVKVVSLGDGGAASINGAVLGACMSP